MLSMYKKLLEMKIGDCSRSDDGVWDIWRVPGGWIYANGAMAAPCAVFVPIFYGDQPY